MFALFETVVDRDRPVMSGGLIIIVLFVFVFGGSSRTEHSADYGMFVLYPIERGKMNGGVSSLLRRRIAMMHYYYAIGP